VNRATRALALLAGVLGLVACSPAQMLTAVSPGGGDRVAEGVAYGGHARQRLDVYAPDDATGAPVVVFLYGGRWQSGERGAFGFVAGGLTARDIVTVIPDYRLYPEVRFPAFVEDAAAALRWTRANIARFGGDPERIFVAGHSAGAHMAALLTLDRRYLDTAADLAGMIGLAGAYDFLPLTEPDLQDLFGPRERYPETQPVHHARGDAPPLLLIHGRADDTVWPENSQSLATAVRAAGGTVETRFYDGVDHIDLVAAFSPWLRFRAPAVREDVADFVHAPPPADPAPTQAGTSVAR